MANRTRNEFKEAVILHMNDIPDRPTNVNYPNGATPIMDTPRWDLTFLSSFVNEQQISGEEQVETLMQIDIYTETETGTEESDGYIDAITKAFSDDQLDRVYESMEKETVDLRGILLVDTPVVDEIGLDGGKYRTAITITLEYTRVPESLT